MDYQMAATWPPDLAKAFGERLMAFWKDQKNIDEYENADTFREARVGVEEEEAGFKASAESGCCGSFEEIWVLPTKPPVKVRYGFNYGH